MSDIRERFVREQGPGGLEARGYVSEARAVEDDTMTISGIGSPYNQSTRIEGWFEEWDEVVAPGAWKRTISKPDADIVSTMNHDLNFLLARTSAGTLHLEESDEGLVYTAEINPDDPQAVGIHARVARRDISGSSVWFRVIKDEWEEPTDDNGLEVAKRTIKEADLYEVGPVVMPAFPQTTSEAASFRQMGFEQPKLAAIDHSLEAAGMTRGQSRAAYTHRFLLTDPDRETRTVAGLPGAVEEEETAAAAESAQPSLDDRIQKHAERVMDWRPFLTRN